ncbi:autoinhibited Ca(2+)-ATPase, isoform 4 [Actinidia rufa]|uniref:Calcium-transporting ATPase n=1 Tax=Actinidia rufa TaxID=165716 RepID=A0A7J0DK51_9ERIC|nr:autoinhibited Ca(2+)-ATPase, isoform 4 [Actinidia rufa]
MVSSRNHEYLKALSGVEGIARCLDVSVDIGISTIKGPPLPVRQEIFGANLYVNKPRKGFWAFTWDALHDITLIILLVCAVISIVLGIAIEGCLKRWNRQKCSIYDLVVGDVVHLMTGDTVPADGILIKGYNLLVDESSLTREIEPLNVNVTDPFLFSGTKVQDGSGKMLVASVGMRTNLGRLMEPMSQIGQNETPLQWSTTDALKLLNSIATAVTVLVVGVPEGMPLAVTLIIAFAARKLTNKRALLKQLSSCETMNAPDFLKSAKYERVLDILLHSIFLNSGSEVVQGKDGTNTVLGTPTRSALLEFALRLGGHYDNICQHFEILEVRPFNSSTKRRSVLVALPEGGRRVFCTGAAEIILHECTKIIICSNDDCVHLSMEQKRKVMDIINVFCCGTLRTLCLVFKDLDDSNECRVLDGDYTLIAVVGISDPVRPEVKSAVQTCLAAGITVRMVTGDNINAAKGIAKECGILTDDGLAIEAPALRAILLKQFLELMPKIQVAARSSPDDKCTLVTKLKSKFGEVIAITGDGTNDASALYAADVGLAMGIAGKERGKVLAKPQGDEMDFSLGSKGEESADVVLMDDNFTTIVNLIKWERLVYQNIQLLMQFQLTISIVALVFNFVSACISGSAPLTVVQLLWVNMISDILGVLALVTKLPCDKVEERASAGRNMEIFSNAIWRNIIGQSMYQLAILFILKFCGQRLLKLSDEDAGRALHTVIFNSFVLCQVFNEINSREIENSRLFPTGIACIVICQVVAVEFLGPFADTKPLGWRFWFVNILIGFLSMPVSVLLKCITSSKLVAAINRWKRSVTLSCVRELAGSKTNAEYAYLACSNK